MGTKTPKNFFKSTFTENNTAHISVNECLYVCINVK